MGHYDVGWVVATNINKNNWSRGNVLSRDIRESHLHFHKNYKHLIWHNGWGGPSQKIKWPMITCSDAVTWQTSSGRLIANKLGREMNKYDGISPIKSYDTFPTWPHGVSQQIKNVSSLPQNLWPPNFQKLRCIVKGSWLLSHMIKRSRDK